MSSRMPDTSSAEADATTPMAPDTDRTAWKQMMQARKERMTLRARKEAEPLEYSPSQQ